MGLGGGKGEAGSGASGTNVLFFATAAVRQPFRVVAMLRERLCGLCQIEAVAARLRCRDLPKVYLNLGSAKTPGVDIVRLAVGVVARFNNAEKKQRDYGQTAQRLRSCRLWSLSAGLSSQHDSSSCRITIARGRAV